MVVSTLGFSVYGSLGGNDAVTETEFQVSADSPQRAEGFSPGPRGMDPSTPPELVHEPPFPLDDGDLPTKNEALGFDKRFSRFIAIGTEGLDELAAQGHLDGSGTLEDPYVLERFYVDKSLKIQSTDRAIILRDGYVNGQLALNYVGEELYVHHVYAKDLRVNENVERNGSTSGGLFHDNHFGFVGQIRHFIGEFRDNRVGPVPQGVVRTYLSDTGNAELPAGVVFNFDGFHGASVHDNDFRGMVDIKLHGHHHGDCLACAPHDHADDRQRAYDDEVAKTYAVRTDEGSGAHASEEGTDGANGTAADDPGFRTRHSIRHHSLHFADNTIHVAAGAPFALRYNDRNHAGDDVTANSEPSEYLEDPHVHYQDVTIRGNGLDGAGLRLEVFNARNDRHALPNEGILRLEDNRVTIPYERTYERSTEVLVGFDLRHADGIDLQVTDNTVSFQEERDGVTSGALVAVVTYAPTLYGFRLYDFRSGGILLEGNTVDAGELGVYAFLFGAGVEWSLERNTFRTAKAWRADEAPAPSGGDGA